MHITRLISKGKIKMDQQTALILIVVNLLAAVVLIIWYLFDRYTKRIESLIQQNNKPSCAFIQTQTKRKG
jgi:hypothetical protein